MVQKHKLNVQKEFDNQLKQSAWERKLRREEYLSNKRVWIIQKIAFVKDCLIRFDDKDFWSRQLEYYRTELSLINKELGDGTTYSC